MQSTPPRRRWFGSQRDFQTNLTLSIMALPGVLFLLVFAYLPMVGLVIAFKDYRFVDGILGSAWVGFDNFRFLFGTDAAWRITRNTLLMNSIFIVTGTIASLTIAILLNEVYTSRMTKYYQTMLFFPYFISWVIVSYFVFAFLSGESGMANRLVVALGGEPISWYRSPEYWPIILTVAHLWNGIGFGSIIYLAGMLSIDTDLLRGGQDRRRQQVASNPLHHLAADPAADHHPGPCWPSAASSTPTSASSSSCRVTTRCSTARPT